MTFTIWQVLLITLWAMGVAGILAAGAAMPGKIKAGEMLGMVAGAIFWPVLVAMGLISLVLRPINGWLDSLGRTYDVWARPTIQGSREYGIKDQRLAYGFKDKDEAARFCSRFAQNASGSWRALHYLDIVEVVGPWRLRVIAALLWAVLALLLVRL